MADDLESIIAGCRLGDPSAQRRLYDRNQAMVYRLAARIVGVQDAADVAQEIFLKVFTGLASFRGTSEFSTWLYRVAVNECLRHQRRGGRRPGPLIAEPPAPEAGPDHLVEQADLLAHALEQLDAPLRAVFLLREAEGLSYAQIAAVLGVPTGTVASQLNRARAELQAFVRRVEQDH